MSFKTVNASVKKVNLINQTNINSNNYEIQEPEIDYSDKKFSIISYITKKFNPKEEDTNSKVVKDDYVINLGFTKIDLEQELENALSNMPFEVVLTDEDKYKLLDVISEEPFTFVPLIKNNIELLDIIRIINLLNNNMDISYDKLSKIVPDLNNVIKNYLDPVLKDIITIDYDNIDLLWDAYLSSDTKKMKKSIKKVCPNIATELSSYIYRNYGIIIDPKKIDYTLVISNCIANFEDVIVGLDECQKLINSDNLYDKFKALNKIVNLLTKIGISLDDIKQVAFDTGVNAALGVDPNNFGIKPFPGGFFLEIIDNINDSYKAMVTDVVTSTVNNMVIDPISQLKVAYNVGAEVISDIKSIFGW